MAGHFRAIGTSHRLPLAIARRAVVNSLLSELNQENTRFIALDKLLFGKYGSFRERNPMCTLYSLKFVVCTKI